MGLWASELAAGVTLLFQPSNLGTSPSWFSLVYICSFGVSRM